MKLLTTNFLTCAVRTCKTSPSSFPLHYRDAQLERNEDLAFQPEFLRNILPRINWEAMSVTANELGLSALVPERNPLDQAHAQDMEVEGAGGDGEQQMEVDVDEETLRKLHTLLMETSVVEGKLVCGNCGFEYPIKEGVANFLLPPHLV